MQMSLFDLPNELYFIIAQHLPDHASRSALMRTDRRRYNLLREYIYDQISGNEKNETLNWAAKHGFENVVRAMLRRGGDIRVDRHSYLDNWDRQPHPRQWIFMALEDAARNGHARILKLLLDHQPSALNMRSGYNDSPLVKAAANGHSEAVMVLLDHSANIPSNAINELGIGPPSSFDFSNALRQALQEGREEIVKILLADGRVKLDGQSLASAAWGGNESLVELCLREAPPWPPKSGYNSPLGAAAHQGHEAVFKMILSSDGVDPNMRDNSLRTPLSVAVQSGNSNITKILLETPGVELDPKENSGATPLLHAAGKGDTELVQYLLATGAVEVDSKGSCDFTPLFAAASNGHEKIVSMLIAAGADPDHRESYGRTALGSAAFFGAGKVVKVLLETGRVDPSSRDRPKMTPLIQAARSGRFLGRPDDFVRDKAYEQETEKIIIPLLRGEKVATSVASRLPLELDTMQDTSTREALSVMEQLLALDEVDPNAQDSTGRTALSHAAEMHEVDAVRILVEDRRVDVNLADNDGWTPMNWIKKKVKPCRWN
ncbi:uncharacterized protein N7496_009020 [Penicillium cataractarum]|uniref:F-box domain-containing protein n=1 Tax=Penicillium cataractarum TaxID=2100454 RepID=A0A9W9RZR1_9EURO|nr:uncharacterized protein N7496_009020 [Penicillium cataractarum]KAJ5369260.1 hypothetical protein N7496_009020 [Penicillium cataractarum]